MSAKLQTAPPSNITAKLNDNSLTTAAADIYVDDTGTSPSSYDHTLAVTVPQNIAVGTYIFKIEYAITENPLPIQTFTTADCQALPIYDKNNPNSANSLASTTARRDIRNNQDYTIRRLQDGKCWMVDNLKLELTNGMTLKPATTNVATDTTVYFTQDGTENGPALAGMTGNFTTSGFDTRDGSAVMTAPNLDVWRQNDPSNTPYCNGTTADTLIGSGIKITDTGSKSGCGYLYNWYTAVAGSATQTSHTVDGVTVHNSICPSGWRLPTGTSTATGPGDGRWNAYSDLAILNASMNANTLTTPGVIDASLYANWSPTGSFKGIATGIYMETNRYAGDQIGLWTSDAQSESGAHIFYLTGKMVGPGNFHSPRYDGENVRCVLN
jgi:uncharacterized protein (TIGR02145 family)